jgi:hypothetical protein
MPFMGIELLFDAFVYKPVPAAPAGGRERLALAAAAFYGTILPCFTDADVAGCAGR